MQRTNAQAHGKATGTARCQAPHLRVGPDGSVFTRACLAALLLHRGLLCLQSRSSLALSPDGNGGLYEALQVGRACRAFPDSEWPYSALCCVAAALCSGAVAH
jgi:hypothetical protein